MGNTERFTGRVDAYERYRQRYPADAILNLLRDGCALRAEQTVADIGAGTGMLAEVFLSNNNAVIAVEPNPEMRAACERLVPAWPQLTVLDASAEATGLPDASIDIVAAGRAFHWFDVPRALTEFRRILKPGGWLVLVSLGRARASTPQGTAFEALLNQFAINSSYQRSGHRLHDGLRDIFSCDFRQAEIPGNQQLDWDALLGQTMSLSVTPAEVAPTFNAFKAALRNHFETYAIGGVLTIETTCWLTEGRL